MKKMLEELKNLDEEYTVPANFKEKVMDRIKNLEKEEKDTSLHTRKILSYQKYVITSLASAAVILIACVVAMKGGRVNLKGNTSMMDKIESMNQTAGMASGASTYVMGEMEDIEESEPESALDTNNVFFPNTEESLYIAEDYSLSASLVQSDATNTKRDAFDNEAAPSQATVNNTFLEDAYEYSAKKELLDLKNVLMNLLQENEIQIVEENEEYLVVNCSMEEIEQMIFDIEVLSGYQEKISLEKLSETNVKIEF